MSDDDGWGRPPIQSTGIIAMDDGSWDGWGRAEPRADEEPEPMNIESPSIPEPGPPYQGTFTDHVLPGCDGVPIAELNQTYVNLGLGTGQMQIVKKKYYTVIEKDGEADHLKLFTVVHTNPFTEEHFGCGHYIFKGVDSNGNVKKVREAVKIGEVYWYKRKQDATIAAAARTLDVFSLRRCQEDARMEPFRRCEDAPYLLAEDAPPLPNLPESIVLPAKLDIEAQANTSAPVTAPKRALKDWYLAFQRKLKAKDGTAEINDPDILYTTWDNLSRGNKMFTSFFVCPLSFEKFASGKLVGKADTYVVDHMLYDHEERELVSKVKFLDEDVDEDRFERLELIWYKTKKEAEDAAAGRAVDCLLLRYPTEQSADNIRYCEEKPYDIDGVPNLWRTVSTTVKFVLQINWTRGFPDIYKQKWIEIPESSEEVPEEVIRWVFGDGEDDAFIEDYRQRRLVQNDLEVISED